ncbi:hypothetical protein MNB_SV-4-59 [hydrothermal vent metagenome]|uniref:Uncharacterized protein n=1 Tax=hydrothermal vent metagenome TaxID=652676 RepID=A0A1W1E7S1_9ZZZZ
MQKMTLKQYAAKHKMSLFNVVKMVKSGALKSESVEENGKEVTYVLVDLSESVSKDSEKDTAKTTETTEARVTRLEDEVARLRRELDTLKISMGLKA